MQEVKEAGDAQVVHNEAGQKVDMVQIKKTLKSRSKSDLVNTIINLASKVDEYKALCKENNIDFKHLELSK